jgi:hypothetical protein
LNVDTRRSVSVEHRLNCWRGIKSCFENHVSELRSQVSAILAVIPQLATKADVGAAVRQLKADVAVETAIIKWIVATVLASAALAFTIAKFVH